MSRHMRHPVVVLALLVLVLGVGLAPPGATAHLGPEPSGRTIWFEVNSKADDNMAHDKLAGDCLCASWFDECTLRAAIEEANACSGDDIIAFHSSLQGTTIYLDSGEGALPVLSETVTISAQSIWDSANDRPGLVLHGGNAIGIGLELDADGCGVYGLYITAFQEAAVYVGSAYNYIGGTSLGQRNVFSGNGEGIAIYYGGAHHNTVLANWIGLAVTGDAANPNSNGISIDYGAHDNTIGGSVSSAGNVISGNTQSGVAINGVNTDLNQLGGNIIGLAADGSTPLGNGLDGVYISNGPTQISIGYPLAGNIIASNLRNGVYIQEAAYFTLQYNTITGNGSNGVELYESYSGQILANTIADNTGHGVYVRFPNSRWNLITANSIHHNGLKGIALVDGGNGELPAPTITSASPTRVEGTACADCILFIYSDSAEEGEIYHGSTNADASGNWVYTGTISGPNATATNTDSSNNTSEFSAPVSATLPCIPVSGVTITGPTTGDPGVAVCFTATVSPANATPPVEYLWDPMPGSGQNTAVACYTWSSAGTYVITATAGNCGGAGIAHDTHTITIGGGACVPVTGVTISGPTTGLVGVTYGFQATVAPANATEPIAYTWTPAPGGGQGTVAATYTWLSAGTYNISVAVSNCGGTGTGSDDHSITISAGTVYRAFLPVAAKH